MADEGPKLMDAPADDDRHRWLLDQYTEIATLAGGLAHEIKNPLSTLILNLQLLAEDFAEPQTQKERRALQKIETLERECKRLGQILEDFLRFARVTETSLKPADLNRVVRDMIEFHAPQAKVQGIVIRDDLPPTIPQVRLDEDLFKQAILNLLLNATQAMPNGGELILKTRSDAEWVYLDVIDTGVGIKPESMNRLFKPFYSTRPGGSGLGLATTKKIIEGHRGKLKVESAPGKGTDFTIQIPIEPA